MYFDQCHPISLPSGPFSNLLFYPPTSWELSPHSEMDLASPASTVSLWTSTASIPFL